MNDDMRDPSRRRLLRLLALAPMLIAGSRWADAAESSAKLAPTPDCGDDDEPTPYETEGPFFKPRSPLRASLIESDTRGTRLTLRGRVFSRSCRPLAGALLDFWHADDDGEYDNDGFRLRGHQFTNANGEYQLETIVPGLYTGRTRHIHVKVQAPHGRVLTSQVYFPREPRNDRDPLFRSDLVMWLREAGERRDGRFNFVLHVD
jgi:protocatechuate 3,4-dioxygenase beta subunit